MTKGRLKDLTGQRFGRLTVLSLRTTVPRTRWLCRCDCGTEKVVLSTGLVSGDSSSCGCKDRHGHTAGYRISPTYRSWRSMLTRCRNPNDRNYPRYGGRGIVVCERWEDFASFLADMGERPSTEHSIDRIDGDGNYELSNCRWATEKEQQRNKRNRRLFTYEGYTGSVAELCERFGRRFGVVYQRLWRGQSIERAMS